MSNHTTDRTCPFCNTRPLLPRSNAATCGAEECTAKRLKAERDRRAEKQRQRRREGRPAPSLCPFCNIRPRRSASSIATCGAEECTAKRIKARNDRHSERQRQKRREGRPAPSLCPFCNIRPLRFATNAATCGDKECTAKRLKAKNDRLSEKQKQKRREGRPAPSLCPFCNIRPIRFAANATTCGDKGCTAKRVKAKNDRTNAETKRKRREKLQGDRVCLFCNTRPLLPRRNATTCGSDECTAKRIRAKEARRYRRLTEARREAKEKERAEIERRRFAPYNEKYRAVYAAAAERASLRRADRGATRATSGSGLCSYCGSRPLRGPKSVTCGDRECMRLRKVARGASKMKPGDVVVAERLFSCEECGKIRIPNDALKDPRYCSVQCLGKSQRKETYREHKYRPWSRLAPEVYERDKYTCWLCGLPTSEKFRHSDPLSPTVDHVVPRSKGGHPTDLENLRCAHFACNTWRNDRESITRSDIEKLLLAWGS